MILSRTLLQIRVKTLSPHQLIEFKTPNFNTEDATQEEESKQMEKSSLSQDLPSYRNNDSDEDEEEPPKKMSKKKKPKKEESEDEEEEEGFFGKMSEAVKNKFKTKLKKKSKKG